MVDCGCKARAAGAISVAHGRQPRCRCDNFPSVHRQKGDTLARQKFYFISPSSNMSLSPIHHSDSILSYKQMTKDTKAQHVTGGA